MKFRNKTKIEDAGINLTPLIDVVFLLLIFFMVSTTFKKNTQLSIELPKASTMPTVMAAQPIKIVITKMGDYEVNGDNHAVHEIKAVKDILAQQNLSRETQLLILGDKEAPHQALVTLLAAAADLHISKVRILAQFEKDIS